MKHKLLYYGFVSPFRLLPYTCALIKTKFFDSEAPHLEEPPGEWGGNGGRLTEFQKLLLLRAIREEKTVFAMRVFVQVHT